MGNDRYTSHQILNKVLDTLAEMVRSTIIREKESQFFAVMEDEMKDVSKTEQMSFCHGTIIVESFFFASKSFLHFEALK
jgi:hypothetical protein